MKDETEPETIMNEREVEAYFLKDMLEKKNHPTHPWTRDVSEGFLLGAQYDGVIVDASKDRSDDDLIRECARALTRKAIAIFKEAQLPSRKQP